jgi:AmmeMemoRadiSam system protein A
MLSEAQRAALLAVARRAVEARAGGRTVGVSHAASPLPDVSGVFVTLRRGGELRGCLGTLEAGEGLAADVALCAADSASRDPRFPRVDPREVVQLTIEISVLGARERIDPAGEAAIEIGRHGLVVEDGSRRGLLLPQVATEWGWTADEFLRQTCRKAHLPGDAWRHGAMVFRFEAEVFGE